MAALFLWIVGFGCLWYALHDMIKWRNEIVEKERREALERHQLEDFE